MQIIPPKIMEFQKSALWCQTFSERNDGLDKLRSFLTLAFEEFRERVTLLVSAIHKDMPSLTVHDITHIDALWWTTSEIAGPDYPLNPAEAFVLGGAFLLHDAAHCLAAYPGGIGELQQTQEWKDISAARGTEPPAQGTDAFQLVLFDVLRTLHPKQAGKLAKISWQAPGEGAPLYLLPQDDLRAAYADAIGQLAESHWWSPHELEVLKHRRINAPTCLPHAPWEVDMLKLAVLLRTADAAHIDAQRAPRFLFALTSPSGSSLPHWQFQSRLHQVKCDPDPQRCELRVSGAPFPAAEQEAWWLAYDAVRLIDTELRAADRMLLEHGIPRLAARSVAFAYSPDAFARSVPTEGWQPVDTAIRITNIKSMVEQFGGEKLYGNDPAMALRELLQNAVDAIHACRKLGYLRDDEGEIEVAVEDAPDGHWLHVTDTGIGMSRYVLTEVLLDFGRSLWRSADLRGEWSGLQASRFEAIGQFGIGFFAVFMLGERVKVLTRRCDPKAGDAGQWLLDFPEGTNQRPILCKPTDAPQLRRHGTRVSVLLTKEKLLALCPKGVRWGGKAWQITLEQACSRLAPALDIDLYVRQGDAARTRVVRANDWLDISGFDLLSRIAPNAFEKSDQAKFGRWSHVDEVRNHAGEIVGRCAAVPLNVFYFSKPGVGVVNGLLAGTVDGIAGVLFVKQQADLARTNAIPDISLSHIRSWAERQKQLLTKHQAIDLNVSALLVGLGASQSGLILGRLGEDVVTYEELAAAVVLFPELLIHQGEVSHDEEDNVLSREFDRSFVPEDALFQYPPRQVPKWLEKIDSESTDRINWTLLHFAQRALLEAWGGYEEDQGMVIVGHVDDSEITRLCTIIRPNDDDADTELANTQLT